MHARATLRFALACMLAGAAACGLPGAAAAAYRLPSDWQRGANFTAWWHDAYAQDEARAALQTLRATGTDRVALIATWYTDSADSSRIAPDPRKTPTDASLLAIAAAARELGMSVVLKPHVDSRDGSFRGDLHPASPDAWLADYRLMVEHYADLARQMGARMLVVGTELTTMADYEAAFRDIIASVRMRFGGELTFAANWIDGARRIRFWDALDYIGVDAYMPLAWSPLVEPTVDDLVSAWREATDPAGREHRYIAELEELHRRFGKPVLFTELGYQSRLGVAASPWWANGAPAQEPQQRAYEAAYRAWSGVPWFKGIYWWEWRASGETDPLDGGFSPAGKPAERTLTEWNTAHDDPPVRGQAGAPPAGRMGAPPRVRFARRGSRGAILRARILGAGRACLRASGTALVSELAPRTGHSGPRAAAALRPVAGRGTRWHRRVVVRRGTFELRLAGLRPGLYRLRVRVEPPCGPVGGAGLRLRVR